MNKRLARLRAFLFALRHGVGRPWRWSGDHLDKFLFDPDGFQWWISADEEHYQGPYGTRDMAFAAAMREGLGERFNKVDGCYRFWMLEARQGPVLLHGYTDADDLLERVCERVDDELGGEEGFDWDFWSAGAEKDLDRQIKRLVRDWQRKYGITIRPWLFTHERTKERYTHVEPDPVAPLAIADDWRA